MAVRKKKSSDRKSKPRDDKPKEKDRSSPLKQGRTSVILDEAKKSQEDGNGRQEDVYDKESYKESPVLKEIQTSQERPTASRIRLSELRSSGEIERAGARPNSARRSNPTFTEDIDTVHLLKTGGEQKDNLSNRSSPPKVMMEPSRTLTKKVVL